MMKLLFIVLAVYGLTFAKEDFKTCGKTEIGIYDNIFSCPSGDYRVTYARSDKEKIKEFKKIGEPKQVIQNIYQK